MVHISATYGILGALGPEEKQKYPKRAQGHRPDQAASVQAAYFPGDNRLEGMHMPREYGLPFGDNRCGCHHRSFHYTADVCVPRKSKVKGTRHFPSLGKYLAIMNTA
jgi:hypothetical protein